MAKFKGKSIISHVLRYAWCAYIYFVWKERNVCFHGGSVSLIFHIVDDIQFVVRYRISDINHVKRNTINVALYENWGMIDKIFV